ncbi:MAG: GNAT family N-acetyltransferase [Agathobacter sp.]|nr:GNAT family N-acetyltransferase [Agathobacter sp.]
MYDWNHAPVLKGILYPEKLKPFLPAFERAREIPLTGRDRYTAGKLARLLAEHRLMPEECLLLTAADEEIRAAQILGMALAAYVDEELPGQSYAGAWIVIEGFEEVDEEFLLRVFWRCHGIPWLIAETKRCVIRELALEDLEDLARLYEEPGITRRIGENGEELPGYVDPLYPMEEELEYQKNYIEQMYRYYGYGLWLVFDRKSGALIGRAGIENRVYPEGVEMELGYLIHPDWQGQGIATEVCSAIIQYAREYLECERLNLLTAGENLPSVALAERLGFVYVGDTDISGSRMRRYMLQLSEK